MKLLLAAWFVAVPLLSDPGSGSDFGPRRDTAERLSAALAEAGEADSAEAVRLAALVRAGTAAGEELGASRAATQLGDAIRDARWRALFEPEEARRVLAGELEHIAADLAFEPLIEAELPRGFPGPTPVGEIEVKRYPTYRAARATMEGSRSQGAFWQLFGHIQSRDIAMTAPVETSYRSDGDGLREAAMSFLYGAPELGEIGRDGAVEVFDAEPASVISLGCRGEMKAATIDAARVVLEEWLAGQQALEAAGELRTMGYNSPMVPVARRYFEVQLPVITSQPPMNALRNLTDFSDPAEAGRWGAVDDAVMGGVSASGLATSAAGLGVFAGTLSLENNGGFASVRTEGRAFELEEAEALALRVRGDGKTYKLRLRTTRAWDGVNYEARFETRAGEWIELAFPWSAFEPVWRGRLVEDAPTLDPAEVHGLGLMISDGQEGSFRLEVESIRALPAGSSL